MIGMGLHNIAAEVQDVTGVVEIPAIVAAAPGQFKGHKTGALTEAGVIGDGTGAIAREENPVDQPVGTGRYPAVVEHEFFRVALIAQFLEAPGQFTQGGVPGYLFPFTLAPFTNPFEGLEDPVRIIDLGMTRLSLG